jgi:soluble lytic murein transglycosylase-like protein
MLGRTVPWLARFLGTVTMLLASLPALSLAAEVRVYTYRDPQGVHHFSRTAHPGWKPFEIRVPGRPSRATQAAPRTGERDYERIIHEYAARYRLEPAFVKAVVRVESGFRNDAVSPRGARGLMQLMPATARSVGVLDLHDPHDNIRGGTRHLRSLLDRFQNDARLALAAYNAGSASVRRSRGVPALPETQAYVAKVLRHRDEYLRRERADNRRDS